jgi:D-alanyl-lipoteichoic acid acyltransferase DltB (MBOAT superfamily)
MLFPTVTFAIFFVAAMAITSMLRHNPLAWKLGLIGSSCVFYAWWDARFLLLLGAIVVGNDLVVRAMERWPRWQVHAMVAGISANLGVLGFFKYYEFFTTSLIDALDPLGLDPSPPLLQIVLPIGLSFYVFEAIAYLVEVRRGIIARLSLVDLATHLTFFPKLFSGPITRPSELTPQLSSPAPRVEAAEAMWLIARGLIKKMVLATYLADAIADDVFSTPGQHSSLEVLVGIYAYTAQIYLDFSAYTDMAIGIALLMGFRLPENFNSPYLATSVQNFWTRWHMTLSRWFRDFVLQPLVKGGSRGTVATARNIMIVMLLTGLWHGAAWTFVIWGGSHGVVMASARVLRERRRAKGLRRAPDTPARLLALRLVTFHFIAFTWVLFRADSLERALDVFARLDDFGSVDAISPLLVAAIAVSLLAQCLPTGWFATMREAFARSGPIPQIASLGLVLLAADSLGPEGVAPFIYFGF